MVLPNLASRYLNEQKLDCPIHYRKRPVQAVDAFITYGKYLMILTDEGVIVFELPKLVRDVSEPKNRRESREPQSWDEGIDVPDQVAIIFSPPAA